MAAAACLAKNPCLEHDLERLGEAYAVDDDVRRRLDYLEQWLDREG